MLADFLLVGGMTLLAIAIFILLKSRKGFPYNLLSIVFASCFFFLLYYYAFLHRSASLAGIAIAFGYGMGFLLGPIILAYIRAISHPKREVLPVLLRQLIPFFTFWVFISVPMALNLFNPEWFTAYAQFIADYADYLNLAENAFFLWFLRTANKTVKSFSNQVRSQYSNLDKRDLSWCGILLKGLTIVVFLDIAISIYELILPPTEVTWNIGLVVAFALLALVVYLGYRGIFQERVFIPEFLISSEPAPTAHSENSQKQVESGKLHYLSSSTSLELETLQEKLYSLLENEKLYTNEKLNLGDLATRLDIPDKKLSEFLNQHLKTSFYDLINTYRVNEVKARMANPDFENLTLLGIALDSGFQSKSSFNRVFKNKTGQSPSEYKKSLSQEVLHAAG